MKVRNILSVAALLVGMTACEEFQPVFTGKYENPEHEAGVSMTATHTIAELAAKYSIGSPWVVDENIIISGVVSTTDQPGNFYKSFYIQDETGGMEIKIGKNGLYNDYLPGQRIYVDCRELCLGMYGYKSGNYGGIGMVQLGFTDPSGSYETSYLESPLLIDSHVFKAEVGKKVEPKAISESDLPGKNDTQKNNSNIGRLVTISNLTYGYDELDNEGEVKEREEVFVLLYLDSNKDKKAAENRLFLTGTETGVTTWAMSKVRMTEYLYSGIWDDFVVGSGQTLLDPIGSDKYKYPLISGSEDNNPVYDKENPTYPGIEKAAASVSHYFSTPNGTCIQLRTSGYSKFADTEIDPAVLDGSKKVSITGVLTMYQGSIQMVVNNIDDIQIHD